MSIRKISGEPPAYLFWVEITPGTAPVVALTARGFDPSDDEAFWAALDNYSRDLLAQVVEFDLAATVRAEANKENAAA